MVQALHEQLRAATRAVHQRLERRLPVLDPDLDRQRYRRILTALWGYHSPLEEQFESVDGWSRLGLDEPDRRRKRRWLRSDLEALGFDAPTIEGLPRCEALPPVRDDPARLGCVYVIEGATLGGRRIIEHLTRHLDVSPGCGGDFFHGYGPATGSRWRTVLDRLETWRNGPAPGPDRVLSGAEATFLTLERWLERRGVLR